MEIREGRPEDYSAFARLFAELETGDDTPSSSVWDGELMSQTLVCQGSGEIAGYIYFQILGGIGYVRHVVVAPDHRGRGLGLALMREVARRLRDAGVGQWCLNVKPSNVRAIGLYEGLGMAVRFASVALRMGWSIIERLEHDASVRISVLSAEDDADAEAVFDLPSGLLAGQRSRAGSRLLLAREAGAIVGLAAFRPEFPGAFPFRARSSGVIRALLVAMQAHADPTKAYVQLVLEDAAELAQSLQAAGATPYLQIVHMRGTVPVR